MDGVEKNHLADIPSVIVHFGGFETKEPAASIKQLVFFYHII